MTTINLNSREETFKKFDQPSNQLLDKVKQRRIALSKQVFIEFGRYFKGIKLYGRSHQSSLRFKDRFIEMLIEALDECLAIDVHVYAYSFEVDGESVFESPDGEDHYIYRMFTDGVRKLIFIQGITEAQIESFISILLTDWSSPQLFEDSMITLLWQANLPQLKFEFIRVLSDAVEVADPSSTEATQMTSNPQDLLNAHLDHLVQTTGALNHRYHFDLSSNLRDSQNIKSLIKVDIREYLEKAVHIIQVAYRAETSASRHENVDQLVYQILELCIHSRSIDELERFMRQSLALSTSQREQEKQITHWTTPLFVRNLLDLLNHVTAQQSISVFACLNLLGPRTIPYVVYALEVVPQAYLITLRNIIVKHLHRYPAEVSRGICRLDLQYATFLIRTIYQGDQHDLILQVVKNAYRHEHREVRDLAIRELPECYWAYEEIIGLYLKGIQDEYTKIKSLCLLRLSQCKSRHAIQALHSYVESHDQLDFIERCKISAVLALSGESADYFLTEVTAKSLGLKGQNKAKYSAWVGYSCALSLTPSELESGLNNLSKGLSKLLITSDEQSAIHWGQRYLKGDEQARSTLIVSLLLRGLLT